jgi:hypothetical protein
MTNFFYGGERKEEYLYIYYDIGIKFCDYCNDIFDRYELVYITPEYYEDPEKMVWTIKLCGECLNVIIHDHDERNFNRRNKHKNLK